MRVRSSTNHNFVIRKYECCLMLASTCGQKDHDCLAACLALSPMSSWNVSRIRDGKYEHEQGVALLAASTGV